MDCGRTTNAVCADNMSQNKEKKRARSPSTTNGGQESGNGKGTEDAIFGNSNETTIDMDMLCSESANRSKKSNEHTDKQCEIGGGGNRHEGEVRTYSAINLTRFCTVSVPDFTPLGGSRPDAAVVGCAAISLYTGGLAEGVIVAPDVLDTALGMLCAPLIVRHSDDVSRQQSAFRCPAVSVRLRTAEVEVLEELRRRITESCQLSVLVQQSGASTALRDGFMRGFKSVTCIDLKRTKQGIQKIGDAFAAECPRLSTVVLPETVTEVGNTFLEQCQALQVIDLQNTALQRVGDDFAAVCRNLKKAALPNTLTEINDKFLASCEKLQVIDLENTALQTVGDCFAGGCPYRFLHNKIK